MTNNVENPNQEKKKRKWLSWGGAGFLITTFAVIILIYLFYATNYYLNYLAKHQDSEEHLLQVQKNMSEVEKQVHQLADNLSSQANMINTLRQSQQSQPKINQEDWQVMYAKFLVQMANDKLLFESNVPQAILLLQTADEKIHALNDDRLLPLRKALADDIASLQAVPQVDIAGLYMRLSALNDQINQLPLPNKPSSTMVTAQPAANENLPWWKRGLQQTWQELQKIVVVRYNENGKPPLIMPEQQDFLYQNLHAAIEKAMWGLLHQQSEIYQASLQQAINWIKKYFVINVQATQSVINGLTELQKVNVHPEVPKISDSLQGFQNYSAESSAKK